MEEQYIDRQYDSNAQRGSDSIEERLGVPVCGKEYERIRVFERSSANGEVRV